MQRVVIYTVDPFLSHMLPTIFDKEYVVHCVATEEWTRRALLADPHAALLLDAQVEHVFERCERLRQVTQAPFIVLATNDTAAERITLLAAGADDVVAQPLQTEELFARLNAKMRRFAVVSANKSMRIVQSTPVRERQIRLSPMETRILTTLSQYNGAFVPLETLQRALWDAEGNENRLRFHICHLRRRLAAFERDMRIEGQRGAGYRLVH